jgi:hypothetical protein
MEKLLFLKVFIICMERAMVVDFNGAKKRPRFVDLRAILPQTWFNGQIEEHCLTPAHRCGEADATEVLTDVFVHTYF